MALQKYLSDKFNISDSFLILIILYQIFQILVMIEIYAMLRLL